MGFLNRFKPASFGQIEEKGDRLFDAGEFGPAKQVYEKALLKLEASEVQGKTGHAARIQEKIDRTLEKLARQHISTARDLLEAGYADDAAELLHLASELTAHPDLREEIERLLAHSPPAGSDPFYESYPEAVYPMDEETWESDEDYFTVLCSTLPDGVSEAYENYGDSFKTGFIALNRGDFENAVVHLGRAMEDHAGSVTHIHLELATAHLNLEHVEESHDLLQAYITTYPAVIRAYELMCEIYWERQAFEEAEKLLSSSPDEIKASIPIMHLMGETFFNAGDYEAAESFYQNSLRFTGWNEPIATALARTLEAMGRFEKARASYGQIMHECRSCRRQANPFVKQRYAELSFEAGDTSSGLLDLFFSLCQEDPQNRFQYYRRISDLYARQGYPEEARRYASLAEGEKRISIHAGGVK